MTVHDWEALLRRLSIKHILLCVTRGDLESCAVEGFGTDYSAMAQVVR